MSASAAERGCTRQRSFVSSRACSFFIICLVCSHRFSRPNMVGVIVLRSRGVLLSRVCVCVLHCLFCVFAPGCQTEYDWCIRVTFSWCLVFACVGL